MKTPRAAETYRGYRRNNYISLRAGFTRFDGWRAWVPANQKANIVERQTQANRAREAAAKALVGNKEMLPASVVVHAYLDFYRREKPSRVVSRIIRGLEQQARKAA